MGLGYYINETMWKYVRFLGEYRNRNIVFTKTKDKKLITI